MRLSSFQEELGSGWNYRTEVQEDIFWRFIRIILSCQSWDRLDRMDWRMREIFRLLSLVLRMILVSGRLLPSLIGNCIWRNKIIRHSMSLLGMGYETSIHLRLMSSCIILTSMILASSM